MKNKFLGVLLKKRFKYCSQLIIISRYLRVIILCGLFSFSTLLLFGQPPRKPLRGLFHVPEPRLRIRPLLDAQLDSIQYYFIYNENQKAKDFSVRKLEEASKRNNPRELSLAYYRLGIVYQHNGMFYMATENFLKSLNIAFANNLRRNIVEISLHLVEINKQIRDNQNNERILSYLIPYLKKLKDPNAKTEAYGIIAETYLSSALIKKQRHDSTGYRRYLDSADENFAHAAALSPHEINFIGLLDIKFEKGQYRELIPEIKKKLNSLGAEKSGVTYHLNQLLAYCYLYTNRPDSALIYAGKYSGRDNFVTTETRATNMLLIARIYAHTGKVDSAYHYMNKAFNLEQDSRIERTADLTKELNVKYQTQQKEKDLENSRKFIAKQKEIILLLIFSSLVVLLIAVLIFLTYLQKKRSHALLEMKNRKITEQSKKLEELTKYKEGLTAMIVHDLKNPLGAIIGLSQDLPTEDTYTYINQAGKKMLDMVHNILDIQKFEEAKFVLEQKAVNISEIVRMVIHELDPLTEEQKVSFNLNIADDCRVSADEDVIHRVLGNIISNAVKYSKDHGIVEVSIGRKNDAFARVTVTDHGSGIPQEQLPYVFKKFWQHNGKHAGKIRSVGLGLSFCKLAVEAHGGDIGIISEAGKGTEVSFTVPLEKVFSETIAQNDVSGHPADENQF